MRTELNAYTIVDTVRWTKERHEMSMGFEYWKQSLDKNFRWLLDPAITFDGSITGYGVADFFIGRPSLLDVLAYDAVGKQDFSQVASSTGRDEFHRKVVETLQPS